MSQPIRTSYHRNRVYTYVKQNVLDNQGNRFLIALDRSKMGLVVGRKEDLSVYEPYQASRRDVTTLEEEGIMPRVVE